MDLREAVEKYKKFQIPSSPIICEKAKQHSKTCLLTFIILFFVFIYLIQQIPHWQVSQFGMTTPKDLADAENSYRATLAQIIGGIAIGISLYYTWRRISIAEKDLKATQENLAITQENLKIAQDNLKVSQEEQITERFTRAIEQLGNEKIEIRLGGIYALERISTESEKDYRSIMDILTAYVRKNSPVKPVDVINKEDVSVDIQAVITVIGRRKHYSREPYIIGKLVYIEDLQRNYLDLHRVYLRNTNLFNAQLQRVNLAESNLERATLDAADLTGAILTGANFKEARFVQTNLRNAGFFLTDLEDTILAEAKLEGANFLKSNLKGSSLERANLTKAEFYGANLEGANFEGANLKGTDLRKAENLTVDQLSKVKTLYEAYLDPELEKELREKGYSHLLDDEPER